jgi:hypothetical protein
LQRFTFLPVLFILCFENNRGNLVNGKAVNTFQINNNPENKEQRIYALRRYNILFGGGREF